MTRSKLCRYALTSYALFLLALAILPPPMAERLGRLYLDGLAWCFTLFLLFGILAYALFFLISVFR